VIFMFAGKPQNHLHYLHNLHQAVRRDFSERKTCFFIFPRKSENQLHLLHKLHINVESAIFIKYISFPTNINQKNCAAQSDFKPNLFISPQLSKTTAFSALSALPINMIIASSAFLEGGEMAAGRGRKKGENKKHEKTYICGKRKYYI